MSFSKAPLKRFNENDACAPPPGYYDVKNKEKNSVLKFEHLTDRFKEPEVPATNGNDVSKPRRKALFPDESNTKSTKTPSKTPTRPPTSQSSKEKKELEKQIRQLLQTFSVNEKELSHCQNEMKKLEGQISNLNKDKSRLETQILSKDKTIQNLHRKNDFLEAQGSTESLEAELKKVKSSLVACKQQMDNDKMKLVSIQCDLNAANCKILNLQESNLKLEQINKDIRDHEDGVSEQLLKLQDHAANLRNATVEAVNELKAKSKEMEDMELKLREEMKNFAANATKEQSIIVQNLEATISEQEHGIAECSLKVLTLSQLLHQTQALNQRLESENASLREEKETLSKSIDVFSEEKIQLTSQITRLERESANKGEQVAELEGRLPEIDRLETLLKKRNADLEELETKLDGTEQEIARLSQQAAHATKDAEEKRVENEELLNCSDELKKKRQRVENEMELLQQKLDEVKSEVCSKNDDLSTMKREKKDLNSQLNTVLFELEQCRKEVDCISSDKRSLELELQKTNNKLDDAKKRDEKCEQEIDAMKNEMKNVVDANQAKLEEFTRRLLETQKRLNEREESVETLEEKCVRLEENLSQSQNELNQHEKTHCDELTRLKEIVENQAAEMEELRAEISTSTTNEADMWKAKYEELVESVGPFKDQLDAFSAEKNFLLNRNDAAQAEVNHLSRKYAELLGHQNQKQKIRHVVKLKEENVSLKQENISLKNRVDTLQKQVVSKRKPKFDPKKAFAPGSSGSTAGKENRRPNDES